MAPFATVYSYPNNFRVKRARVCAALNGLELEEAKDFQMGVTNKTASFLAKWPMGKVPVLETADGFCLAEGAAIATYLASAGPAAEQLLGADPKTKAKVSEWSFFAETEISSQTGPALVMCVMKIAPFDEGRYTMACTNFERAVKRVEAALKDGRKFLLGGDKISLADIMVAGALYFASGFLFDAAIRKEVPSVVKYLQGVAAVPEFKAAFGDLNMLEERVRP